MDGRATSIDRGKIDRQSLPRVHRWPATRFAFPLKWRTSLHSTDGRLAGAVNLGPERLIRRCRIRFVADAGREGPSDLRSRDRATSVALTCRRELPTTSKAVSRIGLIEVAVVATPVTIPRSMPSLRHSVGPQDIDGLTVGCRLRVFGRHGKLLQDGRDAIFPAIAHDVERSFGCLQLPRDT